MLYRLSALAEQDDADVYTDWYTPLDARVSFPVTRLLRGFIEARNLNDEARIRYAGAPERRTAHEIYARDFYVGIDRSF